MKRIIATAAVTLALTSPARADATSAAALLATITFVNESCTTMEPNPPIVRGLFSEMGYNLDNFAHGGPSEVTVPAAKMFAELSKGDPTPTCMKVWLRFGPNGQSVPGVFGWKR